MKIEVWSDFACPFCYIGKRKLEHALSQFEGQGSVEVVYRSFELDPNAPVSESRDIHQVLADKYGMSYDQAKTMNAQLAEQASGAGLDFQFDSIKPTNTFDAHRLSHLAAARGLATTMTERLLKAYFTDGVNLGDHGVLASLAAEVGLEEAETASLLESDAYAEDVRADIGTAAGLGVTGVPFFVFNNKYAISGAQPGPVFTEVLETVWSEEQKQPELKVISSPQTSGDGCADGSCSL